MNDVHYVLFCGKYTKLGNDSLRCKDLFYEFVMKVMRWHNVVGVDV